VVDLYDPFLLENLHYYVREPMSTQLGASQDAADITNHLAQLGDFFICGSERQRDLWMGVLAANLRINPLTFQQDGSLRRLIDVVSLGFPSRPIAGGRLLRGVHPSIPEDARIVLWGGGIWDWLDPLTLVRAWPAVVARHPQARLVFLGTRHPNPTVPMHQMARDTVALAEAMGEKDRSILFFEWLPYADREILLGEADVGVTLHPVHVETRYSIRTRALDYFWARLPVVFTEGDVTSEWVRQYGLGVVVPPFDVEGVAAALNEVLSRTKASWAPAFEPLPEIFNWSRVVEPLRRYCLEGEYAADRQEREEPPAPQRGLLQQAVYLWRTEGFPVMVNRAWRFLQMRLAGF
jgi:glycosyltransferase involved in cell wall biosynthesis